MFGPPQDQHPSAPTSLTPGPDDTNVYDPALRHDPPAAIKDACRAAHREARWYFLWPDEDTGIVRVHVAVSEHRWLDTSLTAADVRKVGEELDRTT